MKTHAAIQKPGPANRGRVLSEILRRPGISRTQIGKDLRLNAASVSRACRDIIAAGLAEETDAHGPSNRPGRRHVGLAPLGSGGYVIGVGINGFRQTVTLADLNNTKIAEWISPDAPGPDGEAFMRRCLEVADRMVRANVANRARFFGIGVAIAAELNCEDQVIDGAPVFGWTSPIHLGSLVREVLNVPLALSTPASAIGVAEADFGISRAYENIITLNCSLGLGIAVRRRDTATGVIHDFGQVLWESLSADGMGRSLSDHCGGRGVLLDIVGDSPLARIPAEEQVRMLVEAVQRAPNELALQAHFHEKGGRAARALSLVIDLMRPECIVLAGPVALSESYVSGFSEALPDIVSRACAAPEVVQSRMTPAGASRFLALQATVAKGDLDLQAIQDPEAA